MSTKYSLQIVTSGLVLALDAANKVSYIGSGTDWYNLSGASNNGTLTNGPTFNAANMGSIVFDGVDDYVSNGTPPISGNQSFSWGAWIRPTATGTPVFFGYNSTGRAMVSYWNSVNNKVTVGTWNLDRLTSGTTILPSTWGTTLTSYTNGIADGTATSFSFNISTTFPDYGYTTIGNARNSQYFNGRISQAFIYNRALSATEVFQNYYATKVRFGL